MKKEILHILPYFEERMWGGTRLKEEFGYKTDVYPIGEVYNVVALRDHADCPVVGKNCTLSELYKAEPDWFDCDTKELPIRVNILDPIADLSVQLHPGDTYAEAHSHSRGKPEAWVILDTPKDGYIEFGHNAKSREEFIQLADCGNYDKLVRYIPAKKDWYIDIPSGTLHAIGKDVLTYNISRNADCTYRLYDYDRIEPSTGKCRQLHRQEVFDNVVVPDGEKNFVYFEPHMENGCEITEYGDRPGLYSLKRLRVNGNGTYKQQRFAFYTVVDGNGFMNNVPLKKGDTVLVPHEFGKCEINGKLDMFIASYQNGTQLE